MRVVRCHARAVRWSLSACFAGLGCVGLSVASCSGCGGASSAIVRWCWGSSMVRVILTSWARDAAGVRDRDADGLVLRVKRQVGHEVAVVVLVEPRVEEVDLRGLVGDVFRRAQ